MSFFQTLDTAATGLSAQRIRINVLSSNMANANTTRNDKGEIEPYRKQNVVFKQVLDGMHRGGVQVDKILPDDKPPMLKFEPGHPDANEEGYVAYPNINYVEELVNLLEASRSYESNVTVMNTAKQLAQQAISIGKK